MKLLHFTYRKLSIFFFLLVTVWGVFFYLTIMDEVIDETDDTLENYKEILIRRVIADPEFMKENHNVMTQYYFRELTEEEGKSYADRYIDSTVYVEIEDEFEPVRVLMTSFKTADGKYHELTLMLSTLERDNMIEAILFYIALLYLIFFMITIFGTKFVLKKAFVPLENLLKWYGKIIPGKPIPPLENDTKIEEFRILNDAAIQSAKRNEKAYQEQKQFIENASHELQTPLAILNNKLELLAETESLAEEQLSEIDDMYRTLKRAVKLNESLLLLSRISNDQYNDAKNISFTQIAEELMSDLLDIYEFKEFNFTYEKRGIFIVKCNENLAHILISNLLKNALNHSSKQASIKIVSGESYFSVMNEGVESLDKEKVFKRFYRGQSENYSSNGLGLSIVKTICDYYKISLSYSFENSNHIFTLHKQEAKSVHKSPDNE